MTASASASSITPASGGALTDASGNVFSFNSSTQIVINGAVDYSVAGALMESDGTNVWLLDGHGQWQEYIAGNWVAGTPNFSPTPATALGAVSHFAQGWPLTVMDLGAANGVKLIRDEAYWDVVETTKGVYDFSSFNAYFAQAVKDGVRVHLGLTFGNPALYDNDSDSQYSFPVTSTGIAGFASYAVAALTNWPQVTSCEVWNEPDGQTFVAGAVALANQPLAYFNLLSATYTAIKAKFPGVTVVGGSTAGVDIAFWKSLFALGAQNYMDVLSVHPYAQSADEIAADIASLQAVMKSNGVTKPIWATEFGNVSDPGYLIQALSILAAAGVQVAFWYEEMDDSSGPTSGLINASGAVTPLMTAWTIMVGLVALGVVAQVNIGDPNAWVFTFGTGATVAWGNGQAVSVPAGYTVTDDQGAIIPAPAMLSAEPIIISGNPTNVKVTPMNTITDSNANFQSGGWSYWALAGGVYTALSSETDAQGGIYEGNALASNLQIYAGVEEPANNGYAAVRRWTAPLAYGACNLVGSYAWNNAGPAAAALYEGNTITIMQNGTVIASGKVTATTPVAINVNLTIAAGDVIEIQDACTNPSQADYTTILADTTINSGSIALAAPMAVNASDTVAYGSSANIINLAAGASGGAASGATIITQPANGSVSISGTSASYTPNAGYPSGTANGSDSFTFQLTNSAGASNAATVAITVLAQNVTPPPPSGDPLANITVGALKAAGYRVTLES